MNLAPPLVLSVNLKIHSLTTTINGFILGKLNQLPSLIEQQEFIVTTQRNVKYVLALHTNQLSEYMNVPDHSLLVESQLTVKNVDINAFASYDKITLKTADDSISSTTTHLRLFLRVSSIKNRTPTGRSK